MIKKEFRFLPAYKEAAKLDSRTNVFFGGAGSGKSHHVAMFLILKLIEEKGHVILAVRKTYRSLNDSVYRLFVSIIHQKGLQRYFNIGRSPLKITYLPNGNEILFYGLDDIEKIKSFSGVTMVWAEEATEITYRDWDQLVLRVRDKPEVKKRFFLTFNPTNSDIWLKSRFIDNLQEDTLVLRTTYKDNSFLDEEYKKALLAQEKTNPNFYKIYTLGEWGGGQIGQIFTNWQGGEWDDEKITDRSYGLDFGYATDPTALVEIGTSKYHSDMYLRQLLFKKELTAEDLIKHLNELKIKKDQAMVADSARPEMIEAIKRAGYNIYPSDKSEKVFNQLNRIANRSILVCDSPDLANEFKMYTWKIRSDGKPLPEPISGFDHLIDAFRYGLQKIGVKQEVWKVWSSSISRKVY